MYVNVCVFLCLLVCLSFTYYSFTFFANVLCYVSLCLAVFAHLWVCARVCVSMSNQNIKPKLYLREIELHTISFVLNGNKSCGAQFNHNDCLQKLKAKISLALRTTLVVRCKKIWGQHWKNSLELQFYESQWRSNLTLEFSNETLVKSFSGTFYMSVGNKIHLKNETLLF